MTQIDDEHAKIGPDEETVLVNFRHFLEDRWTFYIEEKTRIKV